jgi:hypothetical protein
MFHIKFKGSKSFEIKVPDQKIEDLKTSYFNETAKTTFIYKGKTLLDTSLLSDYFNAEETITVLNTVIQQETLDYHRMKVDNKIQGLINHEKALANRPIHPEQKMGYFRNVEPLSGFSDTEKARELLQKLRDDHAIMQIMKEREWRVSKLIELHPSEKTILGYNQNKGQIIALRLRTDELDGFRLYSSIVNVLLHELAHMIFSDHDAHFHQLNRILNQDYQRYSKGNSLSNTPLASFHSKLNQKGGKVGGNAKMDEMREILADAVEKRLSKEEIEIKSGCKLMK